MNRFMTLQLRPGDREAVAPGDLPAAVKEFREYSGQNSVGNARDGAEKKPTGIQTRLAALRALRPRECSGGSDTVPYSSFVSTQLPFQILQLMAGCWSELYVQQRSIIERIRTELLGIVGGLP